MDSSAFSGYGAFWGLIVIVLALVFPLGLWKLVEIIIWIVQHLRVHVV